MPYRPYALLAELTYRCPLHCPYCSNPTQSGGEELSMDEWARIFLEAAELGVLQVGLSGGEPLARADLEEVVRAARAAGFYTNLLTSGIGLTPKRAAALKQAGLDSLQLSFQADVEDLAELVAGARTHQRKIAAARAAREVGLPLSLNVVLHRRNIDRLPEMVSLAAGLGATRLELANVQFYGWAYQNRAELLPTREQVVTAREAALKAKAEQGGEMEIFYVLPDYYEERPKPCMQGWGRRYLTVNPSGQVLPCPTASAIPGLRFENVREKSLSWIWTESDSFNRFRGEEWMSPTCRECPQREIDFGGCRCQAALLAGDPAATDPVCALSPDHALVLEALTQLAPDESSPKWVYRQNPHFT